MGIDQQFGACLNPQGSSCVLVVQMSSVLACHRKRTMRTGCHQALITF
jgi:hypothetical protein